MDQETLDHIRDNGVLMNCQHLAQWAIAKAKGENPAPLEGRPQMIPPYGCVILCDLCRARIAKVAADISSGPVN